MLNSKEHHQKSVEQAAEFLKRMSQRGLNREEIKTLFKEAEKYLITGDVVIKTKPIDFNTYDRS